MTQQPDSTHHVQGTRRTYPIGNTNRVAVIDGWLTKCWEAAGNQHPDINPLLEARYEETRHDH